MKKKSAAIILILIILLSLSSCKLTGIDSDTLLAPPQMNAADRGILKAIEGVSSSYKLVYPKSGSYQTAVILTDIDGDESDEAICFYTDGSNKTVNVIVLENGSTAWAVRGVYSSSAAAVERVSFCDLNGDNIKELIIGWQFLLGEEKALEILDISKQNKIQSLYTGMYNNFISFGDSIVTVSRNTSGKTASASLIAGIGDTISVISTVSLNNSISSFISVQSGLINESRKAIYIDEQLESMAYTTEIVTVSARRELSKSHESISTQTTRTRAYVCADVNDDRQLDLPIEKTFPTYSRNGVAENMSYVEWYNYDGSKTEKLLNAYTSINEKFMITLPDAWIGSITVQRDSETDRAIRFYYTADGAFTPMFSLRVFSQQEYSESVKSLGWELLATSNENVYTYQPGSNTLTGQFKIDGQIIQQLFKLLP